LLWSCAFALGQMPAKAKRIKIENRNFALCNESKLFFIPVIFAGYKDIEVIGF